MKRSVVAFAIAVTFLLAAESWAQTSPAAKSKSSGTSNRIEPQRTLSGVMTGNRIAIAESDWINPVKPMMEYRLTGASLVDGRLEFDGSLKVSGKPKAESVKASLLSTVARSANPWPNASAPTARERKPSGERGEVNEQTQSLYSSTETGSGCEVVFLRMIPTGQKAPLQVGIVLAHQDNETGIQINQAICRVVHALSAKADAADALKKLNQLISRE